MLTKNHLIYDLLEIARGGHLVDDESITPEQVGFWIDNTRALLIKQDIDNKSMINPDIIQTISCLPVNQVDTSECPECHTTGCYIVRTDKVLPETIYARGGNLITRVSSLNLDSPGFSFMSYERAVWTGHNKFTKNFRIAFLRNGYLYIKSNKFINKIVVSGVFEYPEDLANYNNCDGDACYTKDSNYPLGAHMVEIMKGMIIKANFSPALMTRGDQLNDASPEIPQTEDRRKSRKDSE